MSLHNSLKNNSGLGGKRNVLTKIERIKILQKQGKWKKGEKVTGLPKEKIIRLKKLKKEEKVEEKKEVTTNWEDIRK